MDNCYIFTNDENGNPLTEARDMDCDGVPETDCTTWTYDEHGNSVRFKTDQFCDGKTAIQSCSSYTYNEKGEKLTLQ